MSQWKKVKIGDFLKRKRVPIVLDERTKYKLVTVRLYHKGIVLREEKLGSLIKSNMYKVSKGDFILSGIDARNGAFGIIPEELDGAIVTNDFWYFDIDESIIKREYFLWLTSTPVFLDACQKASKGETQRIRLQKEAFFDYEINCPTIEYQDDFLSKIIPVINKIEEAKKQTEQQLEYTKLLRQNILQDAIEGKLTADWRKSHPVIKGNPDYDAEALFEKIQKEKASDKKQKQLPQITDEEKTFEIPEGWKWIHLNQIADIGTGATPLTSETKYYKDGTIPWITSSATSNDFIANSDTYITQFALNETNCSINPIGTLIVAMYGQGKTRGQISELRIEAATNQACATIQLYDTDDISLRKYVKLVFKKMYDEIRSLAQGGAQPNLNLSKVSNTLFPLPPLKEQEEIVNTVESFLAKVTGLENQIQERKILSEKLAFGIIKEKLEG